MISFSLLPDAAAQEPLVDGEASSGAAADKEQSKSAAGKGTKASGKAQAEKLAALKARKKELHGQLNANRVSVSTCHLTSSYSPLFTISNLLTPCNMGPTSSVVDTCFESLAVPCFMQVQDQYATMNKIQTWLAVIRWPQVMMLLL